MIKLVFTARIAEGCKNCRPGIAGANQPPKNNSVNSIDINIICAYSAKKKLAKVIAEYSTLKPETSSDSPSVKSKGARLVSAKADTKNIIAAGNRGITNHIPS